MSFLNNKIYDVLVVGGGINGVGTAVETSGHGLSTILIEQDDLAAHTSSASSKLIHGGLRYLEQFAFGLVKEALTERDVLRFKAPHLVRPIQFLMPSGPHARPNWLIRLGLFLYDHLHWNQNLPKSQQVTLGSPLEPEFKTGFSYYDCTTEDARLVVLNALRAKELGADIHTHTRCLKAERNDTVWSITCQNTLTQAITHLKAKSIINATGAWAEQFLSQCCNVPSPYTLRLVKGSHIVFPRLYEGNEGYLLQSEKDNRVIFVIPYQNQFTFIGTTDVPYEGDPAKVTMEPQEAEYLCAVYNQYFVKKISPNDIIHSWSGVRPLYNDAHHNPSKVTRESKLSLQTDALGNLPIVSVFGGKITTYRPLSQKIFKTLKPFFPQCKPYNSALDKLPGGDIQDIATFLTQTKQTYAEMPESLIERLVNTYGSLTYKILGNASTLADLGHHYGGGLYEKEVKYLETHEWATSMDDILWRRNAMGLLKLMGSQ